MPSLVQAGSGNIFFSENARFEQFTENLFEKEVSGNILTLHYSLAYPERQGISPTHATLGTVKSDRQKQNAQCKNYEKKLKSFSRSGLSTANRLTQDMLLLYFHTEVSLGDQSLMEEPLGPSLGIQAQLPVLLAEYAFYKDQDITDYMNLLVSIEPYFQSILEYEQEKSQAGYFMCDETLDRILAQCHAFIQSSDSSYMEEIFSQKIADYGHLSKKEQEILKKSHQKILKEKVFPAYQKLIDGLESLRVQAKHPRTGSFSRWKEYYQYLLQSQVGVYLPMQKLEQRLSQQLSSDSAQISALVKKSPQLISLLNRNRIFRIWSRKL